MLHRFLFVAGMTVGVMTPLVWMAYVSRPAPHATRVPAIEAAKAANTVETAPATPKPAPVPAARVATKETAKHAARKQAAAKDAATKAKAVAAEDVTAAIPPAATKPSRHAVAATQSGPSAPSRPTGRFRRPRPQFATLAPPRRVTRGLEDSGIPAVVSLYNGAHIITVCAALTTNEQLRAGCP